MARRKKKKNTKPEIKKGDGLFPIPKRIKRTIWGTAFFLLAVIVTFSFFGLSGPAGEVLKAIFIFLTGDVVFVIPFVFLFSGLVFLKTRYKRFLIPMLIAAIFFVSGLAGIFEIIVSENSPFPFLNETRNGGWLGYIFGVPLLNFFDFWVSLVILICLVIAGSLILGQLLRVPSALKEEEKPSLTARIFRKVIGRSSEFKTKELEEEKKGYEEAKDRFKDEPEKKEKEIGDQLQEILYKLPPLDLLEFDKGTPNSGDIKINSAIIKKTLENFDIPVEMSEVSVGPTVTQYSLKPSEGIKLSRITSLSNDLSLALAAHPIRIEAPIPGKSLVGVEIPNKIRSEVRLRGLIDNPAFFDPENHLPIAMGKDVSGSPIFSYLEKMPHFLIAGATGTGKTIFLNTIILSLLFKNSPETLRLILVDPKRVEFTAYSEMPHLLAPVIYDAHKTCNALKWLIGEMERRLQIMSESKTRNIKSYNKLIAKQNSKGGEKKETMPYIVLVVDELADLMAAKGREVEIGIVRLAQMARAAGIHLVLATQRPSVEVITGLIKANITSRVTFQVASQVDSRTVIDTAGAEKLLGAGDLLFITGEISKPKRVQGPYVSEKELGGVIRWMKSQYGEGVDEEDALGEDLEKGLERSSEDSFSFSSDEESDPLYEEARKLVVETKKASASFLQRKLRIGYARAARLIDMMEERGVVGPSDGAKPRDVYAQNGENEEEEWHKV